MITDLKICWVNYLEMGRAADRLDMIETDADDESEKAELERAGDLHEFDEIFEKMPSLIENALGGYVDSEICDDSYEMEEFIDEFPAEVVIWEMHNMNLKENDVIDVIRKISSEYPSMCVVIVAEDDNNCQQKYRAENGEVLFE